MTRSRPTAPDADHQAQRGVDDVQGEAGARLHATATCVCKRCADDRARRTA